MRAGSWHSVYAVMKRLAGIDRFRLAAAVLVIANHTAAFSFLGERTDYLLTYCLGRVAVPFFFMISGCFVIGPWLGRKPGSGRRLVRFLKNTTLLYAGSTVLYLPLMIRGHLLPDSIGGWLRMIVFDGTYYHLWYFPAVLLGTAVLAALRGLPFGTVGILTFLLYAAGVGGDAWYGFFSQADMLKSGYDMLFSACSYTRSGLFFAPFFLWLGAAERRRPCRSAAAVLIFGSFLAAEGIMTYLAGIQRFTSMYFSLAPLMYALFGILCTWKTEAPKDAEKISLYVYVLHPAVIAAVQHFCSGALLFPAAAAASFAAAWILVNIRRWFDEQKSLDHS